eukprot:scaffold123442_cov36-Prasinocladus_malaysianus.AAC.1
MGRLDTWLRHSISEHRSPPLTDSRRPTQTPDFKHHLHMCSLLCRYMSATGVLVCPTEQQRNRLCC